MRRARLALLLGPVAVMVVMTQIADALWPDLVNSAPELLIALSARNRYLVLVAGRIDDWAYYLIGTVRLIAPDPFLFALGWFYGPAALRWMERRTPTVGSMMRTVERLFVRFGHPLVVVIPNNYVSIIAGASRMSPWLFAFLNLTGTVGRLVLLAVVGDVFSSPIDSVLGWVADYRIPLLVISITIVAVGAAAEARRGRKELAALRLLEAEDAAHASADPRPGVEADPAAGDGGDHREGPARPPVEAEAEPDGGDSQS
jgi:membrane protein DedA with SNARE-associated domain